jgi:hypothetical protein
MDREEMPMEQLQPSPQVKKKPDSRQLVITLTVPDSEITMVEVVDKSGKRYKLKDEDFATLVGDCDVEGLLPVIEEAYVAGFSDANGGVFESDESEEDADDDDLEQVVVRGAASRMRIRRGVRKLILARLMRRELLRKQGSHQSPIVTAPEMSH